MYIYIYTFIIYIQFHHQSIIISFTFFWQICFADFRIVSSPVSHSVYVCVCVCTCVCVSGYMCVICLRKRVLPGR